MTIRLGLLAGLALLCSGPGLAAARDVADPGLDMIVIDAEVAPPEPELAPDQPQVEDISWSGAPVDLLKPIHHLYTDLRRQLIRYQRDWSSLPQVRVPEKGAPLTPGTDNARVQALRERLGLQATGGFDEALTERVTAFQRVHGLPVDGKPGAGTLAALNRGAIHYERKLLMNMERSRRLPAPGTVKRYILVDAGAARLWMYEDGRVVDSMKVIVGAPSSATPMMAALMRYASINPYWNVPTDLVTSLIAPKVVSGGVAYLAERRYEVLDSWERDAKVIDPASVDWSAAASGATDLRVRQLPGGANSMGAIKFMMPNEYGIYLHDTPNKALFAGDERWVSNGCVRVEDAERLARWIFGAMPRPSHPDREDNLELFEPMPVYITYLTASPDGGATLFRADPYARDAKVLARFAGDDGPLKDGPPSFTIDLDAAPTRAPLTIDLDGGPAATKRKGAAPARAAPPAKKASAKPSGPATAAPVGKAKARPGAAPTPAANPKAPAKPAAKPAGKPAAKPVAAASTAKPKARSPARPRAR